ncbi:plastocyanin [Marmoricola sp. URHA0025 HA25]
MNRRGLLAVWESMTPPRAPRCIAALIALLGLVLLGPLASARAADTVVSVQDFSFTPAAVTTGLGDTVTWAFASMHTTTSNQRFWSSGARDSGDRYQVRFRDAGAFGYHCSMHPSMTGRVSVPVRASGSSASGWRLTWSVRTSTPANRRFDVRLKRVGTSRWTSYRKATAKRAASFDPARTGTYLVEARTRNVGAGVSGWSPALTVAIS